MRLLLVEDDDLIGAALQALLGKDGHAVDWFRDGAEAAAALLSAPYDLVVLDLGLPRKNGLEVLREVRSRKDRIPVLVATARDAVEDRIAGLDAGADDYLVKPYDYDELTARVRALLRRAHADGYETYVFGEVEIDALARTATRGGKTVELTAREWAVLASLVARPGTVLSREQLEDKLYGWGHEVASNAVEVYVHGLRRKLGADLIQNTRGLGYKVPRP